MICLGPVAGTHERCGLQKGHKGKCKTRSSMPGSFKSRLRRLMKEPSVIERAVAEREMVSHPKHYGGDTPHETVKCLEAWGLETDALLWNAVKYISRAGKKNSLLEDLRKAAWYLQRRITSLENASKSDKK